MINADNLDITLQPYITSRIIHHLMLRKKLRKPLRIAFLDIDSTMTGRPSDTNRTRTLLTELGYAVAYVTTRTEEMLMSEHEFQQTVRLHGFKRPKPMLGIQNGKHVYIPPEQTEPQGILNPDIIAGSTGTQLLLRQQSGGYLPDTTYEQGFSQESKNWRAYTIMLIKFLDPFGDCMRLASIDNPENYHNAKVNVFPPKFRIILRCHTLAAKLTFLKRVQKLQKDKLLDPIIKFQLNNIRITDDSDPMQKEFPIYITPRRGYKARAVEKAVDSICQTLHIERDQLELLLAGDSFPDLEMGLCGGRGTKATFLLVGGSRLTKALMSKHDEFAGEQLASIKQNLRAHKKEGHYTFTFSQFLERNVIIGDKAFQGNIGVRSVLSFLKDQTVLQLPITKS